MNSTMKNEYGGNLVMSSNDWKCKTCKHHCVVTFEDKKWVYCTRENYYPSPIFIKIMGCSGYDKSHEQLDLFKESEDGKR